MLATDRPAVTQPAPPIALTGDRTLWCRVRDRPSRPAKSFEAQLNRASIHDIQPYRVQKPIAFFPNRMYN
jgi:hypothetical protein